MTTWTGSLIEGSGRVQLLSSHLDDFDVTWASRAEQPAGRTSPEELIAAAHSSCFSMALSSALTKAGTPPDRLETTAEVTLVPGTGITGIHLAVRGAVPGADLESFLSAAEESKANCPVSKALAGTEITLTATLD